MHEAHELSFIVKAQDSHIHTLEEMRINAENANTRLPRELENEQQAKESIARILENHEQRVHEQIKDLTCVTKGRKPYICTSMYAMSLAQRKKSAC